MKKFSFRTFLLLGILNLASLSSAGEIFFEGDGIRAANTSGTLQIVFNTEPENYHFQQGGIFFTLLSSTPNVIEFTGGTVVNTPLRWNHALVYEVSANKIGRIDGEAVITPGLPSGNHVVFAEINYKVIGTPGSSTTVSLQLWEEGLYDGNVPPNGAVVASSFVFSSGLIQVVPEPSSLLLSIAVVGLAAITCRK